MNNNQQNPISASRRDMLIGGAGAVIAAAASTAIAPTAARAQAPPLHSSSSSHVTTNDGVQIYFKDWGPKNSQPLMFHHGWPLSSDDWDAQMLYFVGKGYRVVAHDRRGDGRSSQVSDGHDMDHYAADAAAVVEHLDLRNVVHVGHSTGGGQATRYVARHGNGRVAKLALIGAVPPLMVKTPANPGGLPIRASMRRPRAQWTASLAVVSSSIPTTFLPTDFGLVRLTLTRRTTSPT